VSHTHHAEGLVNPKVRAKNCWLLILDTQYKKYKKLLKRLDQVQIIFKKIILDQDRAKVDLRS
jgi:hypothetical protein